MLRITADEYRKKVNVLKVRSNNNAWKQEVYLTELKKLNNMYEIETKEDRFKKELSALLKKYDAEIYFACSDTYGITDDRLEISIKDEVIFKSATAWLIDSDILLQSNKG